MAKFIEFELKNMDRQKLISISVDHIVSVREDEDETSYISVTGGNYYRVSTAYEKLIDLLAKHK